MKLFLNIVTLQRRSFYALSFLLLVMNAVNAHAQNNFQKNSIGIGIGAQWGNGIGLQPKAGLSYERRISVRSGLETGVNYSLMRITTFTNTTAVKEINYYPLFSLPVLYKFHTKAVSIATGPSLNLLTGSTNSATQSQGIQFQKSLNKPAVGYSLKISKPLLLNNNLILEPRAGVVGNQYLKQPQVEAGIEIKYRF